MTFDESGGSRFAADPKKAFDTQAVFWAPETLSTVLAVRTATCSANSESCELDFAKLAGGNLRHAPDGWHSIVLLGGVQHRLWFKELPSSVSLATVDLPLDREFDIRLQAAHRFWLALEERPLGPPPLALPPRARLRLVLALRALDGWMAGWE